MYFKINFEIGGSLFAIELKDNSLYKQLRKFLRGFLSNPNKTPEAIMIIDRQHPLDESMQCSIIFRDGLTLNGPVPVRSYIRSCQALIRNLYTYYLSRNNGILLHASAIGTQNDACIFLGSPGSGKTTIAKSASNYYNILHDDRVIIRKVDGRYRVFTIPIEYTYIGINKNVSYELEKIYILKKNNKNFIIPISTRDAFLSLLKSLIIFFKDRIYYRNFLNIIYDISTTTAAYELNFLHYVTTFLPLHSRTNIDSSDSLLEVRC